MTTDEKKKLAGIGAILAALGLYLWTRKAEAACTEGATKCEGGDLYACVNGAWELVEASSPQCPQPPECEEGDTKCIDTDLYTCVAGIWVLTEVDSASCKVGPIPPLPEGFEIDYIGAEPPVVILGNPVSIKVNWFCPGSAEFWIGRELSLQCVINGETLQHTWTYTGSTTIRFEYTPTSIGTYTATIQGNGISKFNCPEFVSFEVKEEVVGAFYSPFGGYTAYATLSALAEHIVSLKGRTSSTSRPWKTVDLEWAGRHYTHGVVCPYCDKVFVAEPNALRRGSTSAAKVAASYKLLEHIQVYHPDNPLTIPRCHIEISVPQLPSPVTDVWMSPQAYVIKIDGARYIMEYSCAYPTYGYPCNNWLFNNVRLFAVMSGAHHIEVSGPCDTVYAQLGRPCGSVLFSLDVTLQAVGDKVTIDETGEVSIVRWE